MPLTIVVSTGRCGSTMLSRILSKHPDVLSLSEFFRAVTDDTAQPMMPTGDMDGPELWRLFSATSPQADGFVLANLATAEMCYPYNRGRFDPAVGVPAICHATLPLLTDDPDALFDYLAAEVSSWPKRSATEQYEAIFATLAKRLNRHAVVERSGASLVLVPTFRQLFPDARFVFLYRDGVDSALSMSHHSAFRYQAIIAEALRITGLPSGTPPSVIEAVAPEEFKGVLTPPFDALRFKLFPIPLAIFGASWAWQTRIGVAALSAVPLDTLFMLKYEKLLADPRAELTTLANFVGITARSDWLETASTLIEPSRAGAATARLDPGALAALNHACEPGTDTISSLESQYMNR
jgi:Sulfotransferase family